MKQHRRTAILMAMMACVTAGVLPAHAVAPAEAFVSDNIDKGLAILNNKQLTKTQRREQFAQLLLGVTDMRRIAIFTLGRYAATASQAERDAFVAAFQRYAMAVYQSYFAQYAGQTLRVVRSTEHAPGDFVVVTNFLDAGIATSNPLEVNFRVLTNGGVPVLIDFSVAGVWLGLEERDQFVAVLGQNGGSIPQLISHLDKIANQYN